MTEREIFVAALAIADPVEREAFLGAACADAEQKEHLMTLLEIEQRLGSFLESPATAPEVPAEGRPFIVEAPGALIGPYRLVEEIGEGGMGVVFQAEQDRPVRREVALKIIKPGMDSRQVVARFEAERQALALMDHPNIARVLDAGTTDSGRPYFVMELVRGIPITEYCDRQRLGLKERLELFIAACQAIQHAHQKGIIHRDIKPSNLLVTATDGGPVPKVIDFGVAKAIDRRLSEKTYFTDIGQMIGTPAYMSPEQADLGARDVDTRSDIYSLGVLLYELLTGTTPIGADRLREAGHADVLRLIREEDPPRASTRLSALGEAATGLADRRGTDPSRLSRLLSGDLDWILMKALAKDRDRRYDTPGGLAEDLGRYLHGEAIEARPPSVTYRLGRFALRHRGAVLAIGGVTLALVVGSAVAAWQAIVATKARGEMHRAFEAARGREADIRSVLAFVQDRVFAAARPEGQAGGLGREVTLREAIEAALPELERGFRDRPLIEARLRGTLGDSFLYLGEADVAFTQHERAFKILSALRGPDDPDTLQAVNNLAESYRARGQFPEARDLYEETLRRRRRVLGDEHQDTLASLSALANIRDDMSRHLEALEIREDVLRRRREALGADHLDTISSMRDLAISYARLGRFRDSLGLEEKALPLANSALGPAHPETLMIRNNLALSYADANRPEDALKLQDETAELVKAELGADHPFTLKVLVNRGKLLTDLKRHEEAIERYKEVLALEKIKPGPDHPLTLHTMYLLGNAYGFLNRNEEGLHWHAEALAGRKRRLGLDHHETLYSMWGVAVKLVELGRGGEAVPIMDDCLARAVALPANLRGDFHGLTNPRLNYFRSIGDAEGCRSTAELWERLSPTDAEGCYHAARYRAVAAELILAKDPSPAGKRRAETEADRAMSWLRKSVAAGFDEREALEKSTSFNSLRERADFRELSARLGAKPN